MSKLPVPWGCNSDVYLLSWSYYFILCAPEMQCEQVTHSGVPESGKPPVKQPIELASVLNARKANPSEAEGVVREFFDGCIDNGWLSATPELFNRIVEIYILTRRPMPSLVSLLHMEVSQTIRRKAVGNPDYLKENTAAYKELRDKYYPDLKEDKNYIEEMMFVVQRLNFNKT